MSLALLSSFLPSFLRSLLPSLLPPFFYPSLPPSLSPFCLAPIPFFPFFLPFFPLFLNPFLPTSLLSSLSPSLPPSLPLSLHLRFLFLSLQCFFPLRWVEFFILFFSLSLCTLIPFFPPSPLLISFLALLLSFTHLSPSLPLLLFSYYYPFIFVSMYSLYCYSLWLFFFIPQSLSFHIRPIFYRQFYFVSIFILSLSPFLPHSLPPCVLYVGRGHADTW